MRRKDREIADVKEILEIIKKCDSCSVAFFDEEYPYIIPLNFGVRLENDQFELYFHGANVGKKMELLLKNNHVAFEMSCSHKLLQGDKACDTTMEFESVCGNGVMEILENQKKIMGLTVLMSQYQGEKEYEFDERLLKAVTVMKLKVNDISGKRLKR